MAFGLVSTNDLSGVKSIDVRRKIFRQYPTGAAPLMGLMSYLPQESTPFAEYGWNEQRFPTQRTTTAASGTVPFQNGDGTALADLSPLTENIEYRAVVASTSQFKPTHVIEFRELTKDDVTTTNFSVKGIVTQVISATVLKFRPIATFGTTSHGVDNGSTDNNSKTVAIIGTANREYARSGTGLITFPTELRNYTQIFRSAFNISRTALKGPLKYDSRGPWKTQAYDNGLRHMIEMEKAFLFGSRHSVLVADPETGDQTLERTTGGCTWFLEQWEAADSAYRGGTGTAAVTANSDPDKRIIDLGGTITKQDYNTYIDRAFKYTNSKAYEKLAFCGGKALSVLNTLFERDIERQALIQNKERTWAFYVHSHDTLRGTVHYKVHPLFDMDPDLEDAILILDLGNIKYRPLDGSDTELLSGRQERDRDGRKDEWLTEAGMELMFPESCMFLKNVTTAG